MPIVGEEIFVIMFDALNGPEYDDLPCVCVTDDEGDAVRLFDEKLFIILFICFLTSSPCGCIIDGLRFDLPLILVLLLRSD